MPTLLGCLSMVAPAQVAWAQAPEASAQQAEERLRLVVIADQPGGLYERVLGQTSDLDVIVERQPSLEQARQRRVDLVVWLEGEALIVAVDERRTRRPLPTEREQSVRHEAAALMVRGIVQGALADRAWAQRDAEAPQPTVDQPSSQSSLQEEADPPAQSPSPVDPSPAEPGLPEQPSDEAAGPDAKSGWSFAFGGGAVSAGIGGELAPQVAAGVERFWGPWALYGDLTAAFPRTEGDEQLRFRLERYSLGAFFVRRAPLGGRWMGRLEAGGGLSVYRRTTLQTGPSVAPTADSWTPSPSVQAALGVERRLSSRLGVALIGSGCWLPLVPEVQLAQGGQVQAYGKPENVQVLVGLRAMIWPGT